MNIMYDGGLSYVIWNGFVPKTSMLCDKGASLSINTSEVVVSVTRLSLRRVKLNPVLSVLRKMSVNTGYSV